jgi:L-lactate dehydrogenase complex protein LldG
MTSIHGDRNAILKRIHKALKTPAPKLNHPKAENQLPVINGDSDFREWLPPVGESWENQAALFASNAEALKAEFILCESENDLIDKIGVLKIECGWQKIASHKSTFTEKVLSAMDVPAVNTDDGYEIDDLESCDVGITECDALIAQTGSVLVTTQSAGGRALSVLPPHHIVLSRREQLLPDLTAAYQLLHSKYKSTFPTTISLITGPSRTGDIERILVLGAHGPKRLTIFCV